MPGRRSGLIGRGEQTPRHLDARGLGLALTDQAAGAIAVDLFELIAIDRDVAAGAAAASRRASGHSTAKIAAAVISAMTSQSIMAEGYHHGRGKRNTIRRDRAGPGRPPSDGRKTP